MKCPHCLQYTLVLEPAGVIIKDGESIFVQKVFCNNPQCSKYCGKEMLGEPIRYNEVRQRMAKDTTIKDLEKVRKRNEI